MGFLGVYSDDILFLWYVSEGFDSDIAARLLSATVDTLLRFGLVGAVGTWKRWYSLVQVVLLCSWTLANCPAWKNYTIKSVSEFFHAAE